MDTGSPDSAAESPNGTSAGFSGARRRLSTPWGLAPPRPSAANFLLVRVADGPTVHAGLLERGIAVRPSTFPGLSRDHLRVAVRDAAAAGRLVEALTDVLADVPVSTVTADAAGNRR